MALRRQIKLRHYGIYDLRLFFTLLESDSYKYEKKSDIYSLGVLMWELSSGYPPFHNNEDLIVLKIRLIEGIREDPISNTPCEYLKLYQSCWNSEPGARPSIEQVFNKLEEILNLQNNTNHDDDGGGDDDDGDGGDGDGGDGGDGSDGGSTSTSQDSTNELESLDSLQIGKDLT
ncbi:hypothetical protein RhiirC2_855699 [Rhizophagus irregularis]|uniref:Protein kinase domain-containing protein n=1 Tax=Rhizophagus irregularis TaxID=588596 RepID=A0A2N1MLA6_9GLOM|nr:hypothetical protein RhiirC2_855699 [Rhizophagus irregularis]